MGTGAPVPFDRSRVAGRRAVGREEGGETKKKGTLGEARTPPGPRGEREQRRWHGSTREKVKGLLLPSHPPRERTSALKEDSEEGWGRHWTLLARYGEGGRGKPRDSPPSV